MTRNGTKQRQTEPWRLQDTFVLLALLVCLCGTFFLVRHMIGQLTRVGDLSPLLQRETLDLKVRELEQKLAGLEKEIRAKQDARSDTRQDLKDQEKEQEKRKAARQALVFRLTSEYHCTVDSDGKMVPPDWRAHPVDWALSKVKQIEAECEQANADMETLRSYALQIEKTGKKLKALVDELSDLQKSSENLRTRIADYNRKIAALLADHMPGREPASRGVMWFLHLVTLGYLGGMGGRCLLRLLQFRGVCVVGQLVKERR